MNPAVSQKPQWKRPTEVKKKKKIYKRVDTCTVQYSEYNNELQFRAAVQIIHGAKGWFVGIMYQS